MFRQKFAASCSISHSPLGETAIVNVTLVRRSPGSANRRRNRSPAHRTTVVRVIRPCRKREHTTSTNTHVERLRRIPTFKWSRNARFRESQRVRRSPFTSSEDRVFTVLHLQNTSRLDCSLSLASRGISARALHTYDHDSRAKERDAYTQPCVEYTPRRRLSVRTDRRNTRCFFAPLVRARAQHVRIRVVVVHSHELTLLCTVVSPFDRLDLSSPLPTLPRWSTWIYAVTARTSPSSRPPRARVLSRRMSHGSRSFSPKIQWHVTGPARLAQTHTRRRTRTSAHLCVCSRSRNWHTRGISIITEALGITPAGVADRHCSRLSIRRGVITANARLSPTDVRRVQSIGGAARANSRDSKHDEILRVCCCLFVRWLWMSLRTRDPEVRRAQWHTANAIDTGALTTARRVVLPTTVLSRGRPSAIWPRLTLSARRRAASLSPGRPPHSCVGEPLRAREVVRRRAESPESPRVYTKLWRLFLAGTFDLPWNSEMSEFLKWRIN